MAAAMLSGAFSRLSIRPTMRLNCRTQQSLQAPQLSSKGNGITAARQIVSLRPAQVQRSEVEVVTCKLKLKTRKAAAKRYKITGSGKVMVRKPGKQHINEKKSPKQLRRLGKMSQVAHSDLNNIIGCLPNHRIKKVVNKAEK